jgi:hypothetical protein
MSGVVRMFALASVIASVGCGATTSGSSGSTSAPVYTPPSSNAPTTTANTTPTEVNSGQDGVIPSGQELDVRLGTTLSSKTAKVEQRFEATTVADLTQNGRVLVPQDRPCVASSPLWIRRSPSSRGESHALVR